MIDGFLVEEYRAKWEYLRHLESSWESFLKWYATLVGALTALSLGVASTGVAVDGLIPLRPFVLAFSVVYSAFMCLYLSVQKRTYRGHHDRVRQIERDVLHLEKTQSKSHFLSDSRVYFAFPALLGGGLTGLLVYSVRPDSQWYALAAFVLYFGAAMATTFFPPFSESPPDIRIGQDVKS